MPTRAEVIASKILQYESQITSDQNADIDGAIIKLAAAQTANGGGGGGGGTTANAANQVSGNASLDSIDTKVTQVASIDTKLTTVNTNLINILAEMRDDRQIAETVWYDRVTPTLFYVRRATVDEDTGLVTISFQDVSGATATPVIANLVQASASGDVDPIEQSYIATAAGTGYATGDLIEQLQLIGSDGTVKATVWFNRSQNTVITAPSFGNLQVDNAIKVSLASIDTSNNSINTKIPPLGQALAAASTPVVLPATQITTLTPPPAITGFALDTSVNALLKPASTLAAVTTVGSVTAITNALPTGTNSIGQVTANAGTNLNTSLLALENGGKLASLDAKLPSQGQALESTSIPVVLPATQITALTPPSNTGYALDTSVNSLLKPASTLAAVTTVGSITSALPVGTNSIGQVTANAGTNLNTSLLALESGGNLASINTKTPSQGQALEAASSPVVLPATQITALTPPSNIGYSTSALQTTGNTSLTSIDTKLPTQGQKLEAGSTPVVLPLTQITALTPPTNTGYSTSALQTTGNTSLGTINTAVTAVNTKLPAVLGQALVTTSLAVALPITQITSLAAPTVQIAPMGGTFTTDIPTGTITTTTTSASFAPVNGTAQVFQLFVTGVTGTGVTYDVTVQESCGAGIYYDIYVFPTVTVATVNLFSPPIMQASRNYRYVETITGTTPSITRLIQRIQSNINIPYAPITTKLGGASISASEFLTGGRMIKKINVRNGGGALVFLQFHNSLNPLVTGAVPVTGEIYPIASVGNLLLDSTTLGVTGQSYGGSTRVALSLTQQTYTPVTPLTGISLNIEVTN